MTVLTFSLILLFFGYLSGLVGALTGLGGGVVLIPAMVLLLKIDIHYAMGASLICVIATSSGAALAKTKNYVNLRIGILLETAAVLAALLGALLVPFIPAAKVALLFGGVLLFSAYLSLRRNHHTEPMAALTSHPLALRLGLEGEYPSNGTLKAYRVQNVPLAWAIMATAGLMSGLLGIGAGALKVLAMDQALRLPYKVSTTTSNFIMGITAAVSIGVYFSHGYIVPSLTFPVMLGVVAGSWSGSYLLERLASKRLRLFFALVISLLAVQMLYKGFTGNL